jgi:hypothetical protein
MCKEQKHMEAILAGRPQIHAGESVKRFVGARNWSASHDGVVEFQRALTKGMLSEDPSEFVFDVLFAVVTMRYQGFMMSYDKGDIELYCADTQLHITTKFHDDFARATRALVKSCESSFDMDGCFTAWYTHRVAAYERMPFPSQLWRDFVSLCENIWPEIADYETNYNGGDPLFDGSSDELSVVYQFLDEHEFDVLGNLVEVSHE